MSGYRRWVWPIGLALFAVSSVLALQVFVFQGDTITQDEGSYLFQARLLASGRTWAPTPPERNLAQFPSSMINLTRQRWFSRYTVGHPLALVPGIMVRYPPIVPLFLSAMSVVLTYLLARRWYDEHTARVAGTLMALSPFFVAMHATLLSHTTALFCLALFALACAHLMDSRRLGWGILAGASIGYMFNARPYTAVLMGWPFLAWIAWQWFRTRSAPLLHQGFVLGITAALFLGAYFLYNNLTTGAWHVSPYSYYNPTEAPGFGRVMVSDTVHTPARGLRNTWHNLRRLNHWWLGVGGSLWILLGVGFMRWRWYDVALLASAVSLVVGYFFFWFGGVDTVGPVYYFEAILPMSLLGARSLMALWRKWAWRTHHGIRVRTAVAVAVTVGWCVTLPMFYQERVASWTRFFREQRALEDAVARVQPRRALVFLETGGLVWNAVLYDPLAPLDVLYVRSRQNRDARVIAAYPDRQIYRYRGRQLELVRQPAS